MNWILGTRVVLPPLRDKCRDLFMASLEEIVYHNLYASTREELSIAMAVMKHEEKMQDMVIPEKLLIAIFKYTEPKMFSNMQALS